MCDVRRLQASGCETNRSMPETLRQIFRDQLSLDAVAGLVERRREGAETALARRHRDDAAADAALAGQADVVEPVAGGLVQAGSGHHRQRVVTDRWIDHALLGDRVDAAIGQRCAHHGEVLGADIQRALPGVEVHRFHRLAIDAVHAEQELRDAAVAEIGLRGGLQHFLVHRQLAAGEFRQTRRG